MPQNICGRDLRISACVTQNTQAARNVLALAVKSVELKQAPEYKLSQPV